MNKKFSLMVVISLILNAIGVGLAPVPAAVASVSRSDIASSGALPAWFIELPATADSERRADGVSSKALPGWFASPATRLPTVRWATDLLPKWFLPAGSQPVPAQRPMRRDIPLSLLQVTVTGPDIASLGAPPGQGELYTVVVRNNSTDIAHGIYLTATHPSFLIYDSTDQLISRTGEIIVNTLPGTASITWTPVTTYNLAPGEAITLTFRLRAACDAVSGQRLEVGVRYNADPGEPPVELNTGALNVTTGRGNLVINKEPALQSLSASDFGKPITWTITVQNTGLGRLYGAVITDSGGIGLPPPALTPPTRTIPVLEVNETRTFTAVGKLEACNLTNVAQAAWPCGNKVGDATSDNPISSTVSVLFNPEVPDIDVDISSPLVFPYCAPVTRTVVVTIHNTGGPAGNFRLDSGLESDGFLEIVPSSVGDDWQYAGGLFSYVGGVPTGTILTTDDGPVTLTFQVRPRDYACTAGEGTIAFEPMYEDICTNDPFSASPVEMTYRYAWGEAPDLTITKSGPDIVAGGEVFTYQITISGVNADQISGLVSVTDVLPSEFVLVGPITPSTGVTNTAGQALTWQFDPGTGSRFTETLIYQVQAITTAGGVCGASLIVANAAEAFAQPACTACSPLTPTAQVQTAIENNEGLLANSSSAGVYEACGDGFEVVNRYQITGSRVLTWAGAVFTEALGTPIGGGALPGPVYLDYRAGSLSVAVNDVDYTGSLTPVVANDRLVIDLGPLAAAGAPTQNLILFITYTLDISEAALGSEIERTFYDWTQLFLPGFSDIEGCAENDAFNQAFALTIGRGNLAVELGPRILDKCSTNRAVVYVNGGSADRLTDHVVVTFTSSTTEVLSASNFSTTGGLPPMSQINVITDPVIGGERGVITFVLPVTYDLDADGTIQFDLDVNCTDEAPWRTGVTFDSRCAFTYGDMADLDHVYRTPNLVLFTTPVQYTVREKDVLWKFFVANNGNLTATNVVVTNVVRGLAVYTFTADGPDITVLGSLPVTNTAVVLSVGEIPPGEQRAVTVTARIAQCDPLGVDVIAEHGCYGTVCDQPQASIMFDTPDPYLLTNNGETADLPMCDEGKIIFTTKNASSDVSLYQVNITETLRGLQLIAGAPITVAVFRPDGSVAARTDGFTPTQAFSGTDTLLVWRAISATTDVYTWFNALPPLYVIRVYLPVRTSCVAPSRPQSFAGVDAQAPCGKKLGYVEEARTLQTLQPDMEVRKDGRVAGGGFDETIYASPGETITWRIRVYNHPSQRSYEAENVVLSDTWPVNFTFITATTDFSPTIDLATRTITWTIGDIPTGVAPRVFLITGTVTLTDGACSPETINRTRLRYGCDFDGCTSSVIPMDSAQLSTIPDLRTIFYPNPIGTCEGDVPITIRNYGSEAHTNTLTITLPSAYQFITYTVSPGIMLPDREVLDPSQPRFEWDSIPGRVAPAPYYAFTLTLQVQNVGISGACPVAHGHPVTAVLGYDDHPICSDPGPWVSETVSYLEVVTPELDVAKTPRTQFADVGDVVTWTISVANTGGIEAEDVVITDVAGSNYRAVTATVGSDGTSPSVLGNQVVWTLPAPIAPSGVWTARVTATLNVSGTNRNVVTATAYCATGCRTTTLSDTAHTTLLQDFQKRPDIQTGTIGSLAVFTFTTFLPDVDAVYEDLTLIDGLPAGLGYVSSMVSTTYDIDGNQGGAGQMMTDTPAIRPAYLQSGDVVWALGDLSGTVQVDGVITAVIQDGATSYDGARLTNVITMTYTDDGQPYVYTDTADVDVQEPILHLGKRYVTPRGCAATLLEDNFNFPDTTTSPFGGWHRESHSTEVRDGMLHLYNSGDVQNSAVLSDFSLSFMARKNAGNTANMWVIFRATGPNYYDNSYRLEWTGNLLRLQKYVNASSFTDLTNIPGASVSFLGDNAWHHFEIRAYGSRLEVYVDGVRQIAVTDTSHASGYFQIRTLPGSDINIDDVLVTRMEQAGCLVGAGDLVTYTLTISNQGRLPGYDLVVTDALPGWMSLYTYTMESNDPTTPAIVAEPAPIPGASGVITWGIDHLTPTVPFDPLNHTAITLTLVISVSDDVPANVILTNQAALAYDAWLTDTQPTTVTRDYSGGTHSTAVRTVNGGLRKTVAFSPPPTATLGSLVTYTLIVPAPPISATLYDVVITDTVDDRLWIEGVTFSGGVTGSVGWAGQVVTATFASIPHGTQAYVTVTTRISDGLGAVAGDVITNSGVMTHATATEITRTETVSTVVGEPRLVLVKGSNPPTSHTVGAGDVVAYRVTITNEGETNGGSPAYDVVLTDTLPAGMDDTAPTLLAVTLDSLPVDPGLYVTGYSVATGRGVFTVIFTPTLAFSLPVGSVLTIEYAATVDDDVGAGLDLSNDARVTWSSLPAVTPGDRDYGPEQDDTTVHTVLPGIEKSVVPVTATLGDVITYTLRVPEPVITATLYDVEVTDRLSSALQLHTVDPGSGGSVAVSANAFTVTYPSIPHGEQRTITVTAVLSDPLGAAAGDVITNRATLSHATGIASSNETAVTVTEPSLTLVKATPTTSSTVGAGEIVTYTVHITNAYAPTASPAYDIFITDTVEPAGSVQLLAPIPVSLQIDGTDVTGYVAAYDGAAGLLTIDVDDGVGIPVDSVLTLVYRGRVVDDVPAGIDLVNHVSVTWSSLAGPVPGDRDYRPVDDDATIHTSYPSLTLTKSAQPNPVATGGRLTYTMDVTNTGLVRATGVIITDRVPSAVIYEACFPMGSCGESGGVVSWTLGVLGVGASQVVTMVVTVDDPLAPGTIIPNTAWVTSTEEVTDTDTVTTVVESGHVLTLTKAVQPGVARPGERLAYTLMWAVGGNELAPDVTISDTVPAHTTYDDCGPPPCIESGGVVRWQLGDRNPGSSGTVTLTVIVGQPLVSGTLIYNVAVITDSDGLTDTGDITTPVGNRADLTVHKIDEPDPVAVGAWLTYTLVVTNHGPDPAVGVVVTDTLPPEVTFITATTPVTVALPDLYWPLGTMAPGAQRSLTVVVRVGPDVTQTFTNTVFVGSETPEENDDDNEDDEPTTPLVPGLELEKLISVGRAVRNMPFTYTLRITNTGQVAFDPLAVTDTLPAGFYYVTGTGRPSEPDLVADSTLIWRDLGPLAPGHVLEVSFVVTATPWITGVYVNVATTTGRTPGGTITDTDDVPVVIEDPAVVVDKALVDVDRDDVYPNYVTFTVVITNVGASVLDVLPMLDQYDTYYLAFADGTPYPEDDADDGMLSWYDLTGPSPHGFGRNLAPGERFLVTTTFQVVRNIDVTTTNTAVVTDVVDDHDNPANEDDDDEDIGGDEDVPTPIEVLYFRAIAEEEAVRLEWATVAELGTAGFYLYRSQATDFSQAPAIGYTSATGPGSTYRYLDRDVVPGQTYWYWLQEDTSWGDVDLYGPIKGGVTVDAYLWRLYLPLIQREWR